GRSANHQPAPPARARHRRRPGGGRRGRHRLRGDLAGAAPRRARPRARDAVVPGRRDRDLGELLPAPRRPGRARRPARRPGGVRGVRRGRQRARDGRAAGRVRAGAARPLPRLRGAPGEQRGDAPLDRGAVVRRRLRVPDRLRRESRPAHRPGPHRGRSAPPHPAV
ncbi:MAG: Spore_germinatiuon_Immunoglobulin-like, partial [uncultured Nocardioidaceae bacterium]